MVEYETNVIKVDEKRLSAVLDQGMDVYFNLNKFIAE